jgi:hypothetical protein
MCCLYRQVFVGPRHRAITLSAMCITGLAYIAVVIFMSISSWVHELLDREAIYAATASTSVASNVIFCVLPAPWIWELETSKRRKFLLTMAFSWGIVWVNLLERLSSKTHLLILSQYHGLPTLPHRSAYIWRQVRSNMGCWGDGHMDVRHQRLFVHVV